MGTGLSLVIPAYNEADRLPSGLERLMEGLSSNDTEILVVDDGSTDATAEVARRQLVSWPQHAVLSLARNSGKGAAVRNGVRHARGDVIAFLDADMATDPRDLPTLLSALEGNHIAVGSRAHEGSVVQRDVNRSVMNRTFGMLVKSLTQLPYMDTQCGFKAFKGSIAKSLFHASRVDGFAFDVEVLDLAARLGLRIEQVPVRWTAVAGSHVRPIHDSLHMLRDVTWTRLARSIRPVQCVLMPELPIDEAPPLVKPYVRRLDPIVKWGEGTAVLLPCLPPVVSTRAANRLLSDLDKFEPRAMSVEFGALSATISAMAVHTQEIAM